MLELLVTVGAAGGPAAEEAVPPAAAAPEAPAGEQPLLDDDAVLLAFYEAQEPDRANAQQVEKITRSFQKKANKLSDKAMVVWETDGRHGPEPLSVAWRELM